MLYSIIMKRHGNCYAIALVILISTLFGCGLAKDPAENKTDVPDMEEALGREQIGLMQDYEIMEAQDEAAAITDIPDVSESEEVSVIMVGDILLHTPIEKAAFDEDLDEYNYDFIFANTKDLIQQADIAIVNQEVIIGGSDLGVSGYPAFNAPYEIGDALVESGFDVICHATNHALDKGAKGILNCTDYWNLNHPDITMVGIHENLEDSEEVSIIEQNGMRIAVLNYTYGTNGIPLPDNMPYAVDMLSEDKVIADLEYAETNADFTIVVPHWGTEYSLKATDYQKKWAHIFTENGADLIIGAHPHVIEPVEWIYTDDVDDKAALCYYSLGNFVNWTSGTGTGVADRMVGGMADVRLVSDKDGTVHIAEYGIIPLVCHVSNGPEGIGVYRFDDYDRALADSNEIRLQDPAFSYDYCRDLIDDIWGDLAHESVRCDTD